MTYRSPDNRQRNEDCALIAVICLAGITFVSLIAWLTGEVFGWWR